MVRIKVQNTSGVIDDGFDPAAVVKDAIESKKLCLQLVLKKSEATVKSFESKYSPVRTYHSIASDIQICQILCLT